MGSDKRAYVNVEVEFTVDGRLIPRKVRWKDGREWVIDRLIHSCREAEGCDTIRYTVLIGDAEKYLYERFGRWYVLPENGGDG